MESHRRRTQVTSLNELNDANKLFLTLFRLRTGSTVETCAAVFGVSSSCVSKVFQLWIHAMNHLFAAHDLWLSDELIMKTAPAELMAVFPNLKIMIDCLEIESQQPSDPRARQLLYSKYKMRCTWKALTGLTPGGNLIYVSDVYSGCTSDQQMINDY
jgi:hypothetical protein